MTYRRVGTRGDAVSTADARVAVGLFKYRNVQFAYPLADAAPSAGSLVDLKAVKSDRVEESVYRPEGTDVAAERAIEDDRSQHRYGEKEVLPREEPTCRASQAGISRKQKQS